MYSVVLLAALSAGTATPACHCWGGGCGCYGYGWGCGCYGGWGYGYGCYGCYGCGGCYGGWGGCYGWAGNYGWSTYAPVGYASATTPAPIANGASARVVIDVPGDAKLYVDDRPMKSGPEHRVFRTPSLNNGQSYYYVVRAEVVRDGKTFSQDRRVVVRAGDEAHASFMDLGKQEASVAVSSAR